MVARSELRKEAYRYIIKILGDLSTAADKEKKAQCISLDELLLIKEGTRDPSPALVALLKDMIKGSKVTEAAIQTHLVKPFEKLIPE